MAEPFDVTLPAVGAKPWTLNPAVQEIRQRIATVDDVTGTEAGRTALAQTPEFLSLRNNLAPLVSGKVPDSNLSEWVQSSKVEINVTMASTSVPVPAARTLPAAAYDAALVTRAQQNRTAIEAYANALSTFGGGTIRLPGSNNGEYVLDGGITLPSNVWLKGDGATRTRVRYLDLNTSLGVNRTGRSAIALGQVTNVRIMDIGFDGGISAMDEFGIRIDGCKDVLVSGCTFRRVKTGIKIFNSASNVATANALAPTGIRIVGNKFLDEVWDYAIYLQDNRDSVDDPYNNYIEKNYVESIKNVVAGGGTTAIKVDAHRTFVSQNIVMDSDDTGIMVTGGDGNRVTDNILTTRYVSIYVGLRTTHTSVMGNYATSRQDHGMHVYNQKNSTSQQTSDAHITVTGNHFINCGKTGIHLEGARGFNVTGNIIRNPGSATTSTPQSQEYSGILLSRTFQTSTEPVDPSYVPNITEFGTLSGNTIYDDRGIGNSKMRFGIHARGMLASELRGISIFGHNAIFGATVKDILVPDSAPPPQTMPQGTLWLTDTDTSPRWVINNQWRRADGTVVS